MANYAFLDMNNIVTEVVAGRDEGDTNTNWELEYQYFKKQICKRTSYNTLSGKHLKGKAPFRKNYAGIGYTYDYTRDAFIPPKIYDSWILNDETCNWEPPVKIPIEGKEYQWDEDNKTWI
tara:strand:- start:51 stop:410 length:360 start_codon:yes stop_codon:yes gene_type:complete